MGDGFRTRPSKKREGWPPVVQNRLKGCATRPWCKMFAPGGRAGVVSHHKAETILWNANGGPPAVTGDTAVIFRFRVNTRLFDESIQMRYKLTRGLGWNAVARAWLAWASVFNQCLLITYRWANSFPQRLALQS